jgi:hypothetical protein
MVTQLQAQQPKCNQECNHELERAPEDDHPVQCLCCSGVAGAEEFEPPVSCGTLAFKVVDPAISGDRLSGMGRSSAPACHSRALLIAGECNHKCHHCGCAGRDARRSPVPQSEQGVSDGPSATTHTYSSSGNSCWWGYSPVGTPAD